MKKNLISICVFALLLFSCTTIQQDKEVYSLSDEQNLLINDIEKELVFLEAKSFQDSSSVDNQKVNVLLKDISDLLGDVNLQTAVEAKLLAYQGRLFLVSANVAEAKNYYEKSTLSYRGEVESVILGSRLGLIDNIFEQGVPKSQQSLLSLEKALQLYKNQDYLLSLASFDEAFIGLDDFYREAYENLRNNAWKLRDITSKTTLEDSDIVKQEKISVIQMIKLTQNSTDLLYNNLSQKKYSDDALFRELVSVGLFNALNSNENSWQNLSKDTYVTRILAARFLWNLYLGKNGNSGETKYAEQFAALGYSPVEDLPLNSPDFDAVLGCLETAIMDMLDGVNFFPDDMISGIELNESLKKLK